MKSVNPNTRDKFAIFEPITFPTTIEPFSSIAANKLVNISGAEVPRAITVDPIRKGEIPNFEAERTEYFSNFSALIQIRKIPAVINEKVINISNFKIFKVSYFKS